MALMKLVNGLPTTVQAVDASEYLINGYAASTNYTLPGSVSFDDTTGADILIIVNKLVLEITRDFTRVNSTTIQFAYALPNDTVVRVRKYI